MSPGPLGAAASPFLGPSICASPALQLLLFPGLQSASRKAHPPLPRSETVREIRKQTPSKPARHLPAYVPLASHLPLCLCIVPWPKWQFVQTGIGQPEKLWTDCAWRR